ncbi:DUF222 domain-containing protein [Actinomadura scrupuli]|uniref:DUF222 domain-containing protein n=1 Tax=Actinomadura scrupuli TaxID=559629 RepID=UPI003D964081
MSVRLDGASTGELVAAAEAIAAELAVRVAPECGVASMELAERLGRCIDLVEAALAALVGRVDATGAYQRNGFASATAWLRSALGMRHGRASERVTVARRLPRLTRVSKLLSTGALSYGFAAAIAHAVPRLDSTEAQDAEDLLLGMADQGCTVQQVATAADRITDLIAQRQGREPEPEEARRGFRRSWLSRSKSLDGGSWVRAWFNAEHTAAFDQIVGPLARPRAKGDDRDLAQRTADALFSVITEGNRGAGVTVIIDLAAYTAATGGTGPVAPALAYRSTHERTGAGSGQPTGTADAQAVQEAQAGAGKEPLAADPGSPDPGSRRLLRARDKRRRGQTTAPRSRDAGEHARRTAPRSRNARTHTHPTTPPRPREAPEHPHGTTSRERGGWRRAYSTAPPSLPVAPGRSP